MEQEQILQTNEKCYFCYKPCNFMKNTSKFSTKSKNIYEECCRFISIENLGDSFLKWDENTPLPFCSKCLLSAIKLSQLSSKLERVKKELEDFVSTFTSTFLRWREHGHDPPLTKADKPKVRRKDEENYQEADSSQITNLNTDLSEVPRVGDDESSTEIHLTVPTESSLNDGNPDDLPLVNIKQEIDPSDFFNECLNEESFDGEQYNYDNEDIDDDTISTGSIEEAKDIKPDLTKCPVGVTSTPSRKPLKVAKKSTAKKSASSPISTKKELQVQLSRVMFDLDGNAISEIPRRKAALKAVATISSLDADDQLDEDSMESDEEEEEEDEIDNNDYNYESAESDNESEEIDSDDSWRGSLPSKKSRKNSRGKATGGTKKSFTSRKSLEASTLECEYCDQVFTKNFQLKHHIRSKHTKERPFKCTLCDMSFLSQDTLSRHQLKHSEERKYKCKLCDKSYKYSGNLRDHVKTHDDNNRFQCPLCDISYSYERNLREHLLKHDHDESPNLETSVNRKKRRVKRRKGDEADITPGERDGEKVYKCNICEKEYLSKGAVFYHQRNDHEKDPIDLNCEICGKTFKNSVTFKKHQIVHGEQGPPLYYCSICNKEFRSATGRKDHERQQHNLELPFKCEICSRGFVTAKRLKRHTIVHSADRPYGPCPVCGARFRSSSNLKDHLATHGDKTTRKLFECSMCNKSYHSKNYLAQHILRHKGERTYACETCGKRFNTIAGLKDHRMYHQSEKPFLCDECGKSFYTRTKLNIHYRIHTGDLIQCEYCPKKFQTTTHLKQHHRSHFNKNKITTTEIIVQGDEQKVESKVDELMLQEAAAVIVTAPQGPPPEYYSHTQFFGINMQD